MKEIKIHIIFWLLYFTYACLSDMLLGEFSGVVWHLVFFLTHHIIIFYSAYFAIQQFSAASVGQVLRSILFLLLSVALSFAADYFYRTEALKWFIAKPGPFAGWQRFFAVGIVWYINYFLYAIGFYYAKRSVQKERSLRLSEKKRQQTESAFLRSQINPHFLQNTLSYFYAQTLTGNTRELGESILLLSDIMRYSMESPTNENRVSLSKEMTHLSNFIRINQLRFSNELNISFEQEIRMEGVCIVPLIVITLVENAFKHGDLNDPHHPLSIKLEVNVNNSHELRFSIYNKKKTGPKEPSHGIGIENTRRRLDVAYGNDYVFDIENGATHYRTELIIKLRQGRDYGIGHEAAEQQAGAFGRQPDRSVSH